MTPAFLHPLHLPRPQSRSSLPPQSLPNRRPPARRPAPILRCTADQPVSSEQPAAPPPSASAPAPSPAAQQPPSTASPQHMPPAPPDRVPIKRALISVSDKTSLPALARVLVDAGVQILSTGGTLRALADAGIQASDLSEYTAFPELMDGRVKTLHPKIHAALLAVRHNPAHLSAMRDHHIEPIDLVVVNLYPFHQTVAQQKPFEQCVENIDVGGPAMIRAAAKNFQYLTVVTDVSQYTDIISEMEEHHACTTLHLRRRLAAHAFAHLAAYDAAVAAHFNAHIGTQFPTTMLLSATRKQVLRYGENPHQSAAFYTADHPTPTLATAEQVQGKHLSYNNLADTDAAFQLVSEFTSAEPVCAIIKHANPCGVASGVTAQDAYLRALACDPVSAFGGIVALNVTVDLHVAEEIAKMFIEVLIAPDATSEALALLTARKNLRVLLTGAMPDPSSAALTVKSVSGGFLVQTRDNGARSADQLTVASKRQPTADELKNLLFAWKVCKHVKSNAIVYVKDMATVGTGAGQMSRVDASRIAAWKADEASSNAQEEQSRTVGSVVASDAFFPFADGLLAAADAGATAVIQPGGSKRDPEVIAAADERGMALVLTGMRHFRH